MGNQENYSFERREIMIVKIVKEWVTNAIYEALALIEDDDMNLVTVEDLYNEIKVICIRLERLEKLVADILTRRRLGLN